LYEGVFELAIGGREVDCLEEEGRQLASTA
jgi:hypothetical protein